MTSVNESETLVWQEKRKQRFDQWLSAEGVQFASPEAEKNYAVHAINAREELIKEAAV